MKDLLIDKQIGPDWWAKFTGVSEEISAPWVREQLAAFPDGETELRIVIDSPGGDVFEAITIFNEIRDFARSHPAVRVETYVQGMAASAASLIALAANSVRQENIVVVEDNSIFMVHNAWGVVVGNEHDMRESAGWFEKVDGLLRDAYVKRTKKGDKEIAAMMDAETWLWGKEIVDMGFADEVIDEATARKFHFDDERPEGRDSALLTAKAKWGETQQTMQKVCASAAKTEGGGYKAAALALGFKGGRPSATASGNAPGAENKMGGCMGKITLDELKKDSPDVYAAACADGEAAGVQREKERVNRLLAMGKKSGCMDFALECIEGGKNPAEDAVIDAFMDKGAAARALAAQKADEADIPPVNPPAADKEAGAKAMMAGFEQGLKSGGYDDGDD